jgi:RNA binding exosome subunit
MPSTMKRPFSSLHARALCHATEVLERVELAVTNAIGGASLETRRTEGHHGNEIVVVEAHTTDTQNVRHLFTALSEDDRTLLLSTLDQRLDESCNLFLRVDKQAAYAGRTALATTEDSIAVRLKINAYPAKRDVAALATAEFVHDLSSGK